jgi:surface antigen
MILGADSALDGAVVGTQSTGAALDTAGTETSKSLGTALAATGRSLKVAWKAATGWMKPKPKPVEEK